MMRLAICVLLCTATAQLVADPVTFPYQATITGKEAYARSGPGKDFYPTSKLASGTRVTVHRHDPGDWVMIAPPPRSFSWVRSSQVKVAGTKGEITDDNVVVRVGSAVSDTRDVEQRRMRKGDVVKVIGETTIQTARGRVKYVKITPPVGEYRWITLADIGKPAEPKKTDSAAPFPPIADTRPAAAPSKTKKTIPVTPVSSSSGSELETATKVRLRQIDEEFSEILTRRISDWDFTTVESDYDDLRKDAAAKLAAEVDRRLSELAKFKDRKRAYDDFAELVKKTDARDAELRAKLELLDAEPTTPTPLKIIATPAKSTKSKRKFDGAGIVRRIRNPRPGQPRFALLTPDEKLLAYLKPATASGIDLNQHSKRAMGIVGKRAFNAKLGADLILVEKLTPVRLRTQK